MYIFFCHPNCDLTRHTYWLYPIKNALVIHVFLAKWWLTGINTLSNCWNYSMNNLHSLNFSKTVETFPNERCGLILPFSISPLRIFFLHPRHKTKMSSIMYKFRCPRIFSCCVGCEKWSIPPYSQPSATFLHFFSFYPSFFAHRFIFIVKCHTFRISPLNCNFSYFFLAFSALCSNIICPRWHYIDTKRDKNCFDIVKFCCSVEINRHSKLCF